MVSRHERDPREEAGCVGVQDASLSEGFGAPYAGTEVGKVPLPGVAGAFLAGRIVVYVKVVDFVSEIPRRQNRH